MTQDVKHDAEGLVDGRKALPGRSTTTPSSSAASGTPSRAGADARPREAAAISRTCRVVAATASQLLNLDDPIAAIRRRRSAAACRGARLDVLANSAAAGRGAAVPHLLAPCDLQAIKASGVTFVASLLERVIEEQARGDAAKAEGLRASITSVIGDNLQQRSPWLGRSAAAEGGARSRRASGRSTSRSASARTPRSSRRASRCPPLAPARKSASIRSRSGTIPSPKSCSPSATPAASSARRSATTSTFATSKAAARYCWARRRTTTPPVRSGPSSGSSTSISRMDDVRQCDLALHMQGPDGFAFTGRSSMSQISRDPLEIVGHTIGPNHQYPDGLRAVPRHDVRANARPVRSGQRIHPCRRRRRHGHDAATRRAREPRQSHATRSRRGRSATWR